MSLIEKQTLVFKLFHQEQTTLKDLLKESRLLVWHQMLIHLQLKKIEEFK